jgi:hypothetical protein
LLQKLLVRDSPKEKGIKPLHMTGKVKVIGHYDPVIFAIWTFYISVQTYGETSYYFTQTPLLGFFITNKHTKSAQHFLLDTAFRESLVLFTHSLQAYLKNQYGKSKN